MTTEFVRNIQAEAPPFSLIEQQGLPSRLLHELKGVVGELTRDPRGFIRGVLSPDTKDAKRRQRIYAGLTCAVVVHGALLVFIAVLGWRAMVVAHTSSEGRDIVRWVLTPAASKSDENLPRGDKQSGGAGGGDKKQAPATRGPLPQSSPNPQIVKPNTPHVVLPTVQVSPTIMGPEGAPPPPGVALGIPEGVIAAAPSPGPGSGDGLGGQRGSGAGPGSGPGSGSNGIGGPLTKNRNGAYGGSDDPKGPISYSNFARVADKTPIVWIHRPTPIITPEAQANKVKGEVWLRATFGEDGTISDIEVIRDVPFMTESAIGALQRSRFRPATVKGRPITLVSVPVRINVDVFQR